MIAVCGFWKAPLNGLEGPAAIQRVTQHKSIWIGHTRPDHTNPVIREGCVESGRLIFRHMASHAFRLSHRARSSRMIGRLLGIPQNVTTKTNRIIRHWIGRERLVRVVAGDAGNSCVSLHPASAALKAVWCKADVQDSQCDAPAINHILPSAMAGPAKIDRLHRIEPSGIEDLFVGCIFRR